ncbi:MAG: GGDEF domain-containing response regulator [Pseudomonadota bacterium]
MQFDKSLDILIVEDNEADFCLLDNVLKQTEIELNLKNVRTARECVDYLEKEMPDLILLDLRLPDTNGLDAVEKIRAYIPDLPIVVYSGNENLNTAQSAINAGADDYLVKGTVPAWQIVRTLSFAIERRKLHAQINKLAKFDSLTGIANRSTFLMQLEQTLKRVRRNHTKMGLIYLDLDYFKPVNDQYGHKTGDLLLVEVAKRIQATIRNVDVVARLGGDEFAIILDEIDSTYGATVVAEKLIETLGKPFNVEDKILCIGASVGIACITDSINTVDELIDHADAAMYMSKNRGRNQYAVYEELNKKNSKLEFQNLISS